MSVTRLVRIEDAEALAELARANREFLAPWDPVRGEEYYTLAGQRLMIELALREHHEGTAVPHVVLDPSARVVGRATISRIVRGAFQSCGLGYWVSSADNGRGLATAAVADLKLLAFEQLGLHRIEAGTLVHNVRSQRVLERNGFVRFGTAPGYLRIAGRWQDHVLFQVLNQQPEV
jgi:ribosomal-protein-alanine N-acetyltransferase